MKLLVVIPTWNRAEYLNQAIGAIASARANAQNCEVELFVSNNCSTDRTEEVVTRWQENNPWIHLRTWDVHTDKWADIVQRAFTGSGLEYDYAWFQGDDDWITDNTAYTQLAEAIAADPDNPPAIVHCCMTRRAFRGDTRLASGLTEELCNIYGWHDLLGWISSLVLSRETVGRMLASPQLGMTSRSAYVHSEALLEAAYGQTMLVLAAGLIDQQDERQTAESMERWAKAGVGAAYWGIIPGLLNLKSRGILKTPLTLAFFRYLTYSFWDRFSAEVMMTAANVNAPDELISTKLDLLGQFPHLIGFGEDRKLYENWLQGFTDDVWSVRRTLTIVNERIASCNRPSYALNLFPPMD